MIKILNRNLKFYKVHKIKKKSIINNKKKINLLYGWFGLKSEGIFNITYSQLEMARRCVTRISKKLYFYKFRAIPNIPLILKPIKARMGKGKHKFVNKWYYKINKGFILLELSGIEKKIIYSCLKQIKHKLPGKFLIIEKFVHYLNNGIISSTKNNKVLKGN